MEILTPNTEALPSSKGARLWRRIENETATERGTKEKKSQKRRRRRNKVTQTQSDPLPTKQRTESKLKPRLTRSTTFRDGLSNVFGTEERKKKDFGKRSKVIAELVSTEKSYAEGLRVSIKVTLFSFCFQLK